MFLMTEVALYRGTSMSTCEKSTSVPPQAHDQTLALCPRYVLSYGRVLGGGCFL